MPTLTTDQPALTRDQLAKLLNCTSHALYVMARRGEGPPFYRVCGLVRYDKTCVEQWLAAQAGPEAA